MAEDSKSLIPGNLQRPRPAEPDTTVYTEQVWPEGSLAGLRPTLYPDLQTNTSLDTRALLGSVEMIARRHWWSKINMPWGPDYSGGTQ